MKATAIRVVSENQTYIKISNEEGQWVELPINAVSAYEDTLQINFTVDEYSFVTKDESNE